MNNSSFLGEFVCFVNLKLWSHRLNYMRPGIGKYFLLFFFQKYCFSSSLSSFGKC